jgi:hypothetical protein
MPNDLTELQKAIHDIRLKMIDFDLQFFIIKVMLGAVLACVLALVINSYF